MGSRYTSSTNVLQSAEIFMGLFACRTCAALAKKGILYTRSREFDVTNFSIHFNVKSGNITLLTSLLYMSYCRQLIEVSILLSRLPRDKYLFHEEGMRLNQRFPIDTNYTS